jgi:hypothetical protein
MNTYSPDDNAYFVTKKSVKMNDRPKSEEDEPNKPEFNISSAQNSHLIPD